MRSLQYQTLHCYAPCNRIVAKRKLLHELHGTIRGRDKFQGVSCESAKHPTSGCTQCFCSHQVRNRLRSSRRDSPPPTVVKHYVTPPPKKKTHTLGEEQVETRRIPKSASTISLLVVAYRSCDQPQYLGCASDSEAIAFMAFPSLSSYPLCSFIFHHAMCLVQIFV